MDDQQLLEQIRELPEFYDEKLLVNPDFIAQSNSASPRTLYHIEVFSSKTEILWEFTMPETKKGYFVDMILGDFDKDGIISSPKYSHIIAWRFGLP